MSVRRNRMTIRPYQKKDFRYVQDICVAYCQEDDTPINRVKLSAMYCDYYLDNQADYCYVAVDDNDVPVGYILCSVDRDNYEEMMTDMYLPLLRKVSSGDYFHLNAQVKVTSRYVRQGYLAHFYLSCDDNNQEMGEKLVETVENKLREMYVEGIYLLTGQKNTLARAFYEKLGYEDIDYLSGSVVYGKKLYTED